MQQHHFAKISHITEVTLTSVRCRLSKAQFKPAQAFGYGWGLLAGLIKNLICNTVVFHGCVMRNTGALGNCAGNLKTVCNRGTCFSADCCIQVSSDTYRSSFFHKTFYCRSGAFRRSAIPFNILQCEYRMTKHFIIQIHTPITPGSHFKFRRSAKLLFIRFIFEPFFIIFKVFRRSKKNSLCTAADQKFFFRYDTVSENRDFNLQVFSRIG